MGGYIIEDSLKVPKTVLEDVWTETLLKLKDNKDFDLETVETIESMVKGGMVNSDDIVDL